MILHQNIIDSKKLDAAKFVYGKDVKVTAIVGQAAGNDFTGRADDNAYIVDVATKVAGVPVYATYYKADFQDDEIWNVGATLKVADKTVLKAEWMHGEAANNEAGDKNGYVATLAYGGAKAAVAGSWGAWATYYDQPANCYVKQTSNTQMGELPYTWDDAKYDGYKGWEIGANYALAKNIVAAVRYFDIESREQAESNEVLWSEVVFTF